MVTSSESGGRYAELTALFRAGVAGDAASYRRFLQLLSRLLRPLVARRVPAAETEDVLQEILISVHKARHTHDGERPLMPWLLAIVQFRVNDHLRRLYARAEHESGGRELADVPEASTADVTSRDTLRESIDELLRDVPERDRRILTLMYVEGCSAREAGGQLGMKESAVKVAGHRALRKIREKLGRRSNGHR